MYDCVALCHFICAVHAGRGVWRQAVDCVCPFLSIPALDTEEHSFTEPKAPQFVWVNWTSWPASLRDRHVSTSLTVAL